MKSKYLELHRCFVIHIRNKVKQVYKATLNMYSPEYRYETINLDETVSPVSHQTMSSASMKRHKLKASSSLQSIGVKHKSIGKLTTRNQFCTPSGPRSGSKKIENLISSRAKIKLYTPASIKGHEMLKTPSKVLKKDLEYKSSKSFETYFCDVPRVPNQTLPKQASENLQVHKDPNKLSLRVYSPNIVKKRRVDKSGMEI